jgi:hypothetical protein
MSFTSGLATALHEMSAGMSQMTTAMEHMATAMEGFQKAQPAAAAFALPPPIDTATPAAQKATAAAAAAMEEDDVTMPIQDNIALRHRLYKREMPNNSRLDDYYSGTWITVDGTSYQIYRYQLYHYNKKTNTITHHGHYNPTDKSITSDLLVPEFKKAPKGYSARSALYG